MERLHNCCGGKKGDKSGGVVAWQWLSGKDSNHDTQINPFLALAIHDRFNVSSLLISSFHSRSIAVQTDMHQMTKNHIYVYVRMLLLPQFLFPITIDTATCMLECMVQ
jgi:hypothetical protein